MKDIGSTIGRVILTCFIGNIFIGIVGKYFSTPIRADENYKHQNYNSATPISNTKKCLIKGNISFKSGEKIYHLPGCANYNETVINTNYGERRFCTEEEARDAGRRKAKNCH